MGIYLKKTETPVQKDTCISMLIATLFTIVKIWKKPVSINKQIDKKDVIYLYNRKLLSHTKDWYFTICNNVMDMESKSYRERQILYVIIYMWHLTNKTNY